MYNIYINNIYVCILAHTYCMNRYPVSAEHHVLDGARLKTVPTCICVNNHLHLGTAFSANRPLTENRRTRLGVAHISWGYCHHSGL